MFAQGEVRYTRARWPRALMQSGLKRCLGWKVRFQNISSFAARAVDGPRAEVFMFRRRITTQLVVLGLSMCLSSRVVAGPFEDATAAYGRGDFTTALRLLRSLADQGDTEAQNALAAMYEKGEGVAQNIAVALMWYRKAADRGDAEAQLNLGNLYASGQGVPQDYVMAHMWFDLAAAAGIEDASRGRDAIARRMTSAQIGAAQKLAREWKPKSD